jgi:hypothetical protein
MTLVQQRVGLQRRSRGRHPAMDRHVEREPATLHLDQNRRRNPQVPRKISGAHFRRDTLVQCISTRRRRRPLSKTHKHHSTVHVQGGHGESRSMRVLMVTASSRPWGVLVSQSRRRPVSSRTRRLLVEEAADGLGDLITVVDGTESELDLLRGRAVDASIRPRSSWCGVRRCPRSAFEV